MLVRYARLAWLTFACGVGTMPNVTVAQNFQGSIDVRLETSDFTATYTYQIKGNKVRTQTTSFESRKKAPGNQAEALAAYQIWDGDKRTTISVIPSQRMYTLSNVGDMAAVAGQMSNGRQGAAGRLPAMSKTGKKETIAGHTCEHWRIGDDKPADVCLAQGLGFLGMTGQAGMGGLGAAFPAVDRAQLKAHVAAHPELKSLAEGGAFPLRVAMEDGKLTMVVTRVEQASLGDDLFRPPPGYKEVNVGAMMKEMMQKVGKKP